MFTHAYKNRLGNLVRCTEPTTLAYGNVSVKNENGCTVYLPGSEVLDLNPNITSHLMMPGFSLSTNYKALYAFIINGHRIPGWVVNLRMSEHERIVWDIVEIKTVGKNFQYVIGTRGIGYEGDQTLEGFIKTCEMFSLHFIVPGRR